ncbi:dnaJ homolog subfamily C member 17 [Hylaeus anthracinus]|uniref:dnaJ homolog subfamily C member 17 n=1 Tax=Hylaeus anthracinus TaxID=313031 RepID=UPI0023B8B9D4|nr:dnaJ homolog subfamily C member 17 [Hylaeus anthracinus]
MDSLMDRDLYEFIGAEKAASIQEIKKAYRKKALSCHPDKNPNNPKAAELFHELSHALEILTDASARAAYDKVLNAKHQAKLRTKEFDAKRKKLKEDLEAREDAYKRSLNPESSTKSDKDKLQAEIERLRKTGSKQVEEEIAFMKKKIAEQSGFYKESEVDSGSYKIKIKWKSKKNNLDNDEYDYDKLYQIFSKYGDIAALIVSPTKNGSALVEYQNKNDAELAANTEIGFAQNPLKLQKLWDTSKQFNFPKERTYCSVSFKERTSYPVHNNSEKNKMNENEMSDAEFERSVLNNLRKAEEKKRLEMSHLKENT